MAPPRDEPARAGLQQSAGVPRGHCRQGDGEVCGTGVEAAMTTVEGMHGRARATARDYLAAR